MAGRFGKYGEIKRKSNIRESERHKRDVQKRRNLKHRNRWSQKNRKIATQIKNPCKP